jgi:hypothetical protein
MAADPRIMLMEPLEDWPEGKNQLIDVEEYTKLWPRGSTGNKLIEGSSVVYFDYPPNMVILSSPRNRLDITVVIEKQTGGTGGWTKLADSDAEFFVLADNFISHAFSKIEFQINHLPAKTDGFIPNGQGLYETFIMTHLREDAKLLSVSGEEDPAFQTYLRNTDWAPKSAANTTNKWTDYFTRIADKKYFTVNYRPMCFPFVTAPATEQRTYIVPALGQQLTLALFLDTTYQNVFTVHPDPPTGTPAEGAAARNNYRFTISNMELNVSYARMSQLGERALLEKPRASLAQYPGMYIKQYPMFNTTGDQQAIFSVPDVALPSYLLIQAFPAEVLAAGKAQTATFRTRSIPPQLDELVFKMDDQTFYVSPINPGKLGKKDKDMRLLMRRMFYEKPFFRMPCHPDIGKGEIGTGYNYPHLLFDFSNGANGRMQTLSAGVDPKKGKFTIHMKGDPEPNKGLREFYLITFIYGECGVIIDRANKNYISSYFAL